MNPRQFGVQPPGARFVLLRLDENPVRHPVDAEDIPGISLRHPPLGLVDVKTVTLHCSQVVHEDDCWKAVVVLDV